MRKSLMAGPLSESTLNDRDDNNYSPIRLFPDLVVVKFGGHALFDYGANQITRVADVLRIVVSAGQPLLVVTGGGERVRHIMAIARDLRLPPAVMHRLGSKVSEQNACLLEAVLYQAGGLFIHHEEVHKVQAYCRMGLIPIMSGTPPYGWFEEVDGSPAPPHRTDTGALIIAETFGAKRLVLAKDVEGFMQGGSVIPHCLATLMEEGIDSPVERAALRILKKNFLVKQIHLVNCHDSQALYDALLCKCDGGTVIHAD